MPKINYHSQQLIKFSQKFLKDDSEFKKLKKELIREFGEFLDQDRRQLMKKVKAAQIQGALEYGPPLYTPDRLDKEEEKERIDQVGWRMVRLFLEKYFYKEK